ncbi:MAG: ParB N-terminal domain-containing protein [Deltaproteobacteria bacterium]|nr:ParB N-terminal domain-containing protein [Deltaproteobacteria bacterium]
MTDTFPVRDIPLTAVDLEDHTFTVPGGDSTRLLAAIQEVGLLNPPWLRARSDGRWQVITGLKRLRAASELGWPSLAAHTMPAATSESHCLLIGLYDNAFTRGFNLWEQATLARRLLDYWDRATVATKFLPYLGLPASAAHLDRLLKMGKLTPPFQELCIRGRLALTTAATLGGWPEADRAAALPYLSNLPFSQSKQEQFLEDVEILARREGVSAAEVMSRQPLTQLLHDPKFDPATRAEMVRQLLRRWVNPRLSAALSACKEALGRLGLRDHARINLQPPPAFEGPDFRLEIKFRDAQELESLLEEIARLTAQDDFARLTRL